jgi:hypothetical protein
VVLEIWDNMAWKFLPLNYFENCKTYGRRMLVSKIHITFFSTTSVSTSSCECDHYSWGFETELRHVNKNCSSMWQAVASFYWSTYFLLTHVTRIICRAWMGLVWMRHAVDQTHVVGMGRNCNTWQHSCCGRYLKDQSHTTTCFPEA